MRKAFVNVAVLLAVLAAMFAITAFVSPSATQVQAAGCTCPLIYAPVTCDHGKTYPNQCEADCHHAKNCVPSGI